MAAAGAVRVRELPAGGTAKVSLFTMSRLRGKEFYRRDRYPPKNGPHLWNVSRWRRFPLLQAHVPHQRATQGGGSGLAPARGLCLQLGGQEGGVGKGGHAGRAAGGESA